MSSLGFLGMCPDLVEDFDIEVTFPQCLETVFTVPATFGHIVSDPVVNVSRGIWSVTFARTVIAWDGTPTTFPITEQGFHWGLDPGPVEVDPYATGFWLICGWPCNTPGNTTFTEPSQLTQQGFEADPGNGHTCISSTQFDAGCPNCQTQAGIRLVVQAAVTAPEINFKSFKVRAIGTRIG